MRHQINAVNSALLRARLPTDTSGQLIAQEQTLTLCCMFSLRTLEA